MNPTLNDSRETNAKYDIYYRLISEWSKTSHLVQPKTLNDFFERHIEDSKQVIKYIPSLTSSIIDIGTGAGFPGVVLAIEGCTDVTLCEPDYKKIVFLQELIRALEVSPNIIPGRIQDVSSKYDVIVSRACASLNILLDYFMIVSHETSIGIFLKGETWENEVTEANRFWQFKYEAMPSQTNNNSAILIIRDVHKLKQ